MNKQDISQMSQKVLEAFEYCPACRAVLKPRATNDILIQGLICTEGHSYHAPLKTVKMRFHEGEYLNLSSKKKDRDKVAQDWLTDPNLRTHLNDSVAEVLRILLEIKAHKYRSDKQREAAKMSITKYCPKCGKDVKLVGGDGYSEGYKCVDGHEFGTRGLRLTFPKDPKLTDGSYLQLCLDSPEPWSFVDFFVTKAEWKKSIAPQVRIILKEYADELKQNRD